MKESKIGSIMNNIGVLNKIIEERAKDCKNISELLHEYKFGGVKQYFVEEIILEAINLCK